MDSRRRSLTFILVILPIVSFFAQRFFAVQANQLELFSTHIMVNYADWLFVPFNLFVLYAANFSRKKLFIFLGISLVFNIGINFYWSMLSGQGIIQSHLFVSNSPQITIGGIIHLLFSWFQAGLVGVFFIYTKHNKYVIYCLVSMVFYALTLVFGSYIFHNGKPLITDLVLCLFLLAVIFYNFYIYRQRAVDLHA